MQASVIVAVKVSIVAAACAAVVGCGLGAGSAAPSPVTVKAAFSGKVYGGQQPIVGATIQLYATGNTGYGSAPAYANGVSLLGGNAVQSQPPDGNFSIHGDFACPSPSTLVYIEATGGNPNYPGGGANANLALMAALGPCGDLGTSTVITMNELTTVASVWALSPFMTGPTQIGTSAGNAEGLVNAFAAVNNLVDIGKGTLDGPTLPPGASLPAAKLNTLADVLARCVNSHGGAAGDGSGCGTLFANSGVNGATPADTITAAMNMAQNPHQNVSALVGTVSPQSPFQPTLPTSPAVNDLNVVISYTAGGLSSPSGVAADAAGNVWVANAGANTVTEMTGTGGLLSGPGGYAVGSLNVPVAIAIDQEGNAWVANKGNSTVSKIAAGGASGTPYSGGGLSSPTSVAVDAYDGVWLANAGSSTLTKATTSGSPVGYSPSGVSAPVSLVIDPK